MYERVDQKERPIRSENDRKEVQVEPQVSGNGPAATRVGVQSHPPGPHQRKLLGNIVDPIDISRCESSIRLRD